MGRFCGNARQHVARTHKLTIDDVKPSDAGDYTFVPNGYALSLSAKLNFLGEIPVIPRNGRRPRPSTNLGLSPHRDQDRLRPQAR